MFPAEELYGLTSQVRRSAVSIPSNLAEGSARRSTREYAHFLTIALGSLAELETQLLICNRLDYCEVDPLIEQVNRVRALLLGIRNKQAAP
jgi:four helix bundle protein